MARLQSGRAGSGPCFDHEKAYIRQGLFWAHLTLEKMLKAHVCKQTCDMAPRIHNLVRLAELTGLELQEEDVRFLGLINDYNMEGRYIEHLGTVPEWKEAKSIMHRVGELTTWLNERL